MRLTRNVRSRSPGGAIQSVYSIRSLDCPLTLTIGAQRSERQKVSRGTAGRRVVTRTAGGGIICRIPRATPHECLPSGTIVSRLQK